MNKRDSYTSANAMPFKLLKDQEFMKQINTTGKIKLRHLQLCPTNKCNLNCSFCSCNAREKKDELSLDDLKKIIDIAKSLGVIGITITGGGEPLLHPHINEFLDYTHSKGIKMGLVSNAIAMKNINPETINKLTWARISFADSRDFNQDFIDNMNYLREKGKDVDLAFSYVAGREFNPIKLNKIIEYANANHFTHVRVVPDLYNTEYIEMEHIENSMNAYEVNTEICIFQKRSDYTGGIKECAISLLKPLIAPDGYIYPCCGVQYALHPVGNSERTFPKEMRMGHYLKLPDMKKYNGIKCAKCYYENYNVLLNNLQKKYEHVEFA